MKNEIKDTIFLAALVVCFLAFCGCMIVAAAYPVGTVETKTALYGALSAAGAGLIVWGVGMFND